MMTINGERVWIPGRRQDLVAGLRRMGILKVAGKPMSQVSKNDLLKLYCREKALIVRRQQWERRQTSVGAGAQSQVGDDAELLAGAEQLSLFA